MKNAFDDIRPYDDNEVRPAIERLLGDSEFLATVARFRFPRTPAFLLKGMQPMIAGYLRKRAKDINTVHDLQLLVERYLKRMLDQTSSGLTVSGTEHLDPKKAHLFISNHRDIVVDPALVNWALHHNGHSTLNIAIGDNLLTKPFISDLMRLNKSFIVNRSATAPREKLKAAKHLSAYIHYAIVEENNNIWIAQREGRAKDGIDQTNSAVIRMLTMSKPKDISFADYVRELNIVPVSISYEWDPCDKAKAKELHTIKQTGSYEKGEQEDAKSIARGITGKKGKIHVAFGEPLQKDYADTDEIVADLDQSIIKNYVLHPSNCIAYEELHGKLPDDVMVGDQRELYEKGSFVQEKQMFRQRLANCDEPCRELLMNQYANPVISQQSFCDKKDMAS